MKINTYMIPVTIPEFTPFRVDIRLETQEEAQQFYSLFNTKLTTHAVPALDAEAIRATLHTRFLPDSRAHRDIVDKIERGIE